LKKRCIIITVENFKDEMALKDNVLPLAVEGILLLGQLPGQP
jgi:hypothetical protein